MSDNEEHITYRATILKGAENYPEWELSIGTILLAKDLYDCIEATTLDANKKEQRKAFALIIQSLSTNVQQALSAEVRSITKPDPQALWKELKRQYSAAVGARTAALLQDMWSTHIGEGEDPNTHLGRIHSAHAQINAANDGDRLSDKMLAYAMTMALPDSFVTIKQNLWLRDDLNSSSVQAAIQAEWARRQSTDTMSSALVVNRGKHNKNTNKGDWPPIGPDGNRMFGKDRTAFCDKHKAYGHLTKDCRIGQARFAATPNPKQSPAQDNSSAFNTHHGNNSHTKLAMGDSDYVVDSGASDHMVNNIRLLTNVQSIPHKHIIIGNGTHLSCQQQGDLQLGDLVLRQVLFVPDLERNLIATNKAPVGTYWEIDSTTAVLRNKQGDNLLVAKAQNGLYCFKASDSTPALNSPSADVLLHD